MQLKTKLFAPVFVILMLGMANSAFATLTCTATVVNVASRATINVITAVTGDIQILCNANDLNATTETQFSISYGVPITNSRTSPAARPIRLVTSGAIGNSITWDPIGGTQGAQTGILAAAGVLQIIVAPYTPTVLGAQGGFTVQNVLLSLAGGTVAGQDLKVNINPLSQNNTILLTGAPVTVIGQILPAINSTTAAPGLTPATLTAQFTSTGGTINPTRSNFSITATENYIDAWRAPSQWYSPQVGIPATVNSPNGTFVQFTFAGMLPGSLIQNCVATINPAGALVILTGTGIAGSNGQATLTAELGGGATDMTTIETVTLQCGQGTTLPAYAPGTSTGAATSNVTYSVTMSPLGTNYPGPMGTIQNTEVPRYLAGTNVAGVTVIGFTGATTGQTTMIIPFALGSGAAAPVAGSFDTGISIANTTKNAPAFISPAEGGATAKSGNVSFTFFPADGSASFTITPTTGFGLATGAIPSGGSFIANVSEILRSGGNTAAFSGYIIVTANFTHAHGSAFLYGGALAGNRITSYVPVLVIGNPGFQPRDAVGTIPNAELTEQ